MYDVGQNLAAVAGDTDIGIYLFTLIKRCKTLYVDYSCPVLFLTVICQIVFSS